MTFPKVRALAVLPLALLILSGWEATARGSYWERGHYDPEYQYLLNGLTILEGGAPYHIDHPGTTLQLLVAVALKARYLVSGPISPGAALRVDVLAHPETYLRTLQRTLSLCAVLVLFLAAEWVQRRTGLMWRSIGFQSVILLSPSLAHSLVRVSPEPVLIIIVLLAAPLLVESTHGGERRSECWKPLVFGLLLGAGLVTKLTFLPLLLLILWFAAWRDRGLVSLGLFLGSLLVTVPVWPQAPRILEWIGGLVLKQNLYGSGPGGFLPEPQVLLAHLRVLLLQEPIYAAALVSLILEGASLAGSRARDTRLHQFRVNLALVMLLAGLLMAAKFGSPRYLVPQLALLGPLLLVEGSYWSSKLAGAIPHTTLRPWVMRSAILMLAATALVSFWHTIQSETRLHRATLRLDEALAKEYAACTIIPFYGASDARYGLQLADDYTSGFFSADLARLYPGSLAYHIWSGRFQRFDGFVPAETISDSVARGECILLRGLVRFDTPGAELHNPQFDLEVLPLRAPEVVYRLRAVGP